MYHNLTAHYNGYFNGKEALKDGEAELAKTVIDNYNKVLPPVNYGGKESINTMAPSTDRAISKASMVIQRHSIFIKNVEHVKWIDDSYFLIGKSYFYKQDYKTALKTFDFLIKRYKNSNIKNDVMLWTIKCHIQMKEFDMAESLLDNLKNSISKKQIDRKFERDLALTYAEFFIKQENYPPSEEYLIKTLEYHYPKTQRARLNFIMGQIAQRRGDLQRATAFYQKVINMNPGYEMAFNARINQAKCFDVKSGKSSEIVKSLMKMLKDEKNKEYQDQIYFALAEITEKEGDTTKTIEYLRLSVATSVKNKYQKGIASIKIANIYYSQPRYRLAQAYYDTAVQELPSDYPDLFTVKNRAMILNELVKNIKIVENEDSLQRIALMSEKERINFIDNLIKKIQEQEAMKKKEEAEHAQGMAMIYRNKVGNQQNGQGGTGGSWYFYNPSSISYGFTEFEKKWGKRKLEDNWRLSNKEMVAEFNETAAAKTDTATSDSLKNISKDPKDRKTYLQNLPMTEPLMAKSIAKVKDALYNMGAIYYQGLNDPNNSAKTYETIINRFANDTALYLKACFNLFDMYREIGNDAKAEVYKNLILSKFPESDYAKIIKDPEYRKILIAKKSKASNLYKETYEAYENDQFSVVLANCNQANGITEDKKLMARFDYLRAIAIGKLQKKDSMEIAFKRWLTRYPTSDLRPLVIKILDRMGSKDSIVMKEHVESEKPIVTIKNYAPNPDAIHLFVFITDIRKINVNALKIKISDYNQKYNRLDKLNVSSLFLDDSHQMITISNFQNKDLVMTYFSGIMANEYINSSLVKDGYKAFAISVDNYPIFYKNKDVEKYLEFFQANY